MAKTDLFAPVTSPAPHPLTPSLWRVVGRRVETADVVTISLSPEEDRSLDFRHGQFNMLTAFGVGEVAVSVSSAPGAAGPIEHSIRDVGAVTHALCNLPVGGTVGLRGPFGEGWDVDGGLAAGRTDVVVVAGGIGLAPLRGAVRDLVEHQARGEARLFVLVGARSPDQIVFADDIDAWRDAGAHVDVSVDVAPVGWPGTVGVVTALLPAAPFDPARAVALICGPEIMMRFSALALVDRGVDPDRIRISLERNMQCGVGFCGHCQLGPLLVCRDGPVVPYGGVAAELLRERQR
jgi:anaerobic sulfite reductase subunit B